MVLVAPPSANSPANISLKSTISTVFAPCTSWRTSMWPAITPQEFLWVTAVATMGTVFARHKLV